MSGRIKHLASALVIVGVCVSVGVGCSSSRGHAERVGDFAPAAKRTGDEGAGPADGDSFVDEKWHVGLAAYAWVPTIKTRLENGGSHVDSTAHPSDILDNLDLGYMAMAEVRRNRLGFFVDTLNMDLEDDENVGPQRGIGSKLEVRQGMVQVGSFYRFGDRRFFVDAMAGARFFYTKFKLRLGNLDRTVRQDWWEPVIGSRAYLRLARRWGLLVRGDAGGFSIGEAPRLTWQVFATVKWDVSDSVSLHGGYRYYFTNYHHGADFTERIMGPIVGIAFQF